MNDVIKIKRAIVTGPTGAVGVAVINELVKNDIEVIAICRRNSKRISSIPLNNLVRIVECNLNELEILPKMIGDAQYDAFFHLAWDGTYGDLREDLYLQNNNVRYTLDAVKAAAKLHCKVFVGAGSQAEYGHVESIISPRTPCNPTTGYGIAKLSACMMSRNLCKKYGIRHEWCRIISLFGPYDGAYTMIMSGINKMLNGEHASYTKGEQNWDYIYSKDAAKAFYLSAEFGKDGAVYCLGSGKTRKLKEYILAIRDIIDPAIEIGIGELEYYDNQVMNLQVDISDLVRDTGFQIRYSFEEGIRETIEWAKENSK